MRRNCKHQWKPEDQCIHVITEYPAGIITFDNLKQVNPEDKRFTQQQQQPPYIDCFP